MLYDKLKSEKRIPFHMPGHKRNTKLLGDKLPYNIDLTEIEGLDNLQNPTGIIKEIEEKAKAVYYADKSFLLVNGSTVGILAGVLTAVKRGDTVLIARNCHKSVYNAVELAGASAEYIVPKTDKYGIFKEINVKALEEKIQSVKPKLVVFTSPTYEGVGCENAEICEIAHRYGIPVLLDAAHGAHYDELAQFADITVMSLHKTLPALTQCALAHVSGNLINADDFGIKLSTLQTSSPSYVLMASIDECLSKKLDYSKLVKERDRLIKECESLRCLKLLDYGEQTKLVVFTGYGNISGAELADILRTDYNIEVEMASRYYVVLVLTACDDFSNYKRLSKALIRIDSGLTQSKFSPIKLPDLPAKQSEAFQVGTCEYVKLADCAGKVSGEYIWAYPPGIPLIVPGEIITAELIAYINDSLENGVNIQSTRGKLPEKIYCQFCC